MADAKEEVVNVSDDIKEGTDDLHEEECEENADILGDEFDNVEVGDEEIDEAQIIDEVHGDDDEEVDELELDASSELKEEDEASKNEGNESKTDASSTEKKKDNDADEEEDPEENEEAEKKIAEKFDPNQMPQVNVNTLAKRQWQVKVYPLRPSDFMSGEISRVFKQAKESLLYVYTEGNNGRYSNGKAELYMASPNHACKVTGSLIKMDFYHPETNIKIIRKNAAGVVLEKAYMRFDTKMASHLFQPIHRGRPGTKRERLIGSVFLKNLPDGATKEMLRVMFPFAAEINFNPEKFKESHTARLVLSNRKAVIPCLKAFSKVELGGNILELRPLEKRSDLEDVKMPIAHPKDVKSGSKSSTPSKDVAKDSAKDVDKSKQAEKKTDAKDPAKKPAGSGDSKDKPKAAAAAGFKKPESRGRGGGDRRGGLRGRQNSRAGRRDVSKFSPRSRWADRVRGGRGSGRGRFADEGRPSRRSAGSPGRSAGAGMSMSGDGASGEVTKEMMALQSQLSMAIKNQISMLNQTQMAVEQAKRGAAATTAAAVAQAMKGVRLSQAVAEDQYNRAPEQNRRASLEASPRQRAVPRNRQRERANLVNRGPKGGRGGRGGGNASRDVGRSSFGAAREAARSGFATTSKANRQALGGKRGRFESESYQDTYGKRPNFGTAATVVSPVARSYGNAASQRMARSWAEESEDLDPYGAASSYRQDEYDDGGYEETYSRPRLMASNSARAFGSGAAGIRGGARSFGGAGMARNSDYGYDY